MPAPAVGGRGAVSNEAGWRGAAPLQRRSHHHESRAPTGGKRGHPGSPAALLPPTHLVLPQLCQLLVQGDGLALRLGALGKGVGAAESGGGALHPGH